MGQQAIAVQKMYRRAGTQMDGACKELPTHIGVELSFMNFLCEREAAVVTATAAITAKEKNGLQDQDQTKIADSAGYRELQIKFLQEHLNAWFPQLSQTIQSKAKTQFYRGLALITEAFLAVDTAGLLVP
jgi:TorA maturation chaperone TorD